MRGGNVQGALMAQTRKWLTCLVRFRKYPYYQPHVSLCRQAYLPRWKWKRNLYWISVPPTGLPGLHFCKSKWKTTSPIFMLDLIGQFPVLKWTFWLTVMLWCRLAAHLWLSQAHCSSIKTSPQIQTHSSSLRLSQPLHLLSLKIWSCCNILKS